MYALNYTRLDYDLVKSTLRYYLLLGALMVAIFFGNMVSGIGYGFFLTLLLSSVPFTLESNERCDRLYRMLPGSVDEMVLGRYLYLGSLFSVVWGMALVVTFFFAQTLLSLMLLTGLLTSIIALIQYPLYYKFGMEKGKVIAMAIYLLPALLVMMAPGLMREASLLWRTGLVSDQGIDVIGWAGLLILPILAGFAYLSYRLSVSVCKRREI